MQMAMVIFIKKLQKYFCSVYYLFQRNVKKSGAI